MVLPVTIAFLGNQISLVLLGIAIFVLVFIFMYWFMSRRDQPSMSGFDTAFGLLIFALIGSRAVSVLINFQDYTDNLANVFNFLDKNFVYIGIFLGLVFGTLIIFKISSAESEIHHFLGKVVISYVIAAIPLLLLVLLAGKMQGIVVTGGLSIGYDNGVLRMPVNLFRIAYNLLFLILWLILGRKESEKPVFGSLYLLLFGTIEFILRFFAASFQPNIIGGIDFQQLIALVVMVMGIILIMDAYNIKLFKLAPKYKDPDYPTRKQFSAAELRPNQQSSRERFSMSYSSIQDSANQDELTLKEKFRIFSNTFKRKLKK